MIARVVNELMFNARLKTSPETGDLGIKKKKDYETI